MTTLNSALMLWSWEAVAVKEITLPSVFQKNYSLFCAPESVLLQRNIVPHRT